MKIKRLEYLLVGAEDVEEAAAAWRDVFGLTVAPETRAHNVADLSLENCALRITSDAERVGLLAIGLEVEGLEEAVRELRRQGVAVTGPAKSEEVLSAEIQPESAHGVTIRLTERLKEGA